MSLRSILGNVLRGMLGEIPASPRTPSASTEREAIKRGYAKGYRAGKDRGDVQARYESAQNTAENLPLWQYTDYLSAKAANSIDVRRTLKIRSRYEASNNSY